MSELFSQVNPLADWTQFGVLGAVVGALFWLLTHTLSSHKEERTEWRTDASTRSEKTDAVIKDLTQAIREQKGMK